MANTSDYFNHTRPDSLPMSIKYNLLASRIGIIMFSIIYIFGFTGNTFALITFSSRRMRQISSSIFLLVLSISDTLALVTSLWYFLADTFGVKLQDYSALACRFRTFFAYVFMDLSSWCIAGLAVDRYLRTKLPFASKTICTPRNALLMILSFFLVLCGINGHYFSPGIGQERGGNLTKAHCLENRDAYPNYYHFYKNIWPIIDSTVFCFLPACVMIICNVKIICLLRQKRHHLENTHYDGFESTKTSSSLHQTLTNHISIKRTSTTQRKVIERQMSLMMAACVIEFLCATVPVTLSLSLLERVIVGKPHFARDNPYLIFIFRILRTLMYVHFGSNFYLYCLTSRMFRSEFIQTITCRRYILTSQHEHSTSMELNKIADV